VLEAQERGARNDQDRPLKVGAGGEGQVLSGRMPKAVVDIAKTAEIPWSGEKYGWVTVSGAVFVPDPQVPQPKR